jgi:hypothetical protein
VNLGNHSIFLLQSLDIIQGVPKKNRTFKKVHYSAKNYPNKMPLDSDIAYIHRYYHADLLKVKVAILEVNKNDEY